MRNCGLRSGLSDPFTAHRHASNAQISASLSDTHGGPGPYHTVPSGRPGARESSVKRTAINRRAVPCRAGVAWWHSG